MKQYRNITFSILLGLSLFTSCEELLEVEPEEVVFAEDYLGDDDIDARSALFGVLSQLQEVVEQYVVLGELRADLVNVNDISNDELREVSNHEITENNSYADLTTIFSIINNCNFALEGIDIEANENKLLDDYASILRIRTWAQMQILINYGKLPYITEPIKTSNELDDTYPILSLNEALDQLIENLQEVEGVENVTKYGGSLGFDIFNMIPDQNVLLGDLYLWKGENVLAATRYKNFLDENVANGLYSLANNDVTVTLEDGKGRWSSAWGNIFNEGIRTNAIINYVAFSDQFRQPNSAFSLLKSQIKPSASIVLNWLEQDLGFVGEPVESFVAPGGDSRRNISTTFSETIINKYQEEYFAWNRAAKIYLRYAEAINYAGHSEQALTVLNGIFNNPDLSPASAAIFGNEENYLNFDDDIYFSVNTAGLPISGHLGIRGRVGLAPVGGDIDLESSDAMEQVGALILNEAALELAFEGNRWEDLLRFASRANNPAILADAVANKFEVSGSGSGTAIQQKLLNPDNWYLPLTLPDNFVEN